MIKHAYANTFAMPVCYHTLPILILELRWAVASDEGEHGREEGEGWRRVAEVSKRENGGSWVAVGIICGLFGLIFASCFASAWLRSGRTIPIISKCCKRRESSVEAEPEDDGSVKDPFEERIESQRARKSLAETCLKGASMRRPYSGEYKALTDSKWKIDESGEHEVNLLINFHEIPAGGYELSGHGWDNNGKSIITEGFVDRTGDGYWVEERGRRGFLFRIIHMWWCFSQSGVSDRRVLSRGQFNFADHTFTGLWVAASGESSSYWNFRALRPIPDGTISEKASEEDASETDCDQLALDSKEDNV